MNKQISDLQNGFVLIKNSTNFCNKLIERLKKLNQIFVLIQKDLMGMET